MLHQLATVLRREAKAAGCRHGLQPQLIERDFMCHMTEITRRLSAVSAEPY
jgi:hypothetical protein